MRGNVREGCHGEARRDDDLASPGSGGERGRFDGSHAQASADWRGPGGRGGGWPRPARRRRSSRRPCRRRLQDLGDPAHRSSRRRRSLPADRRSPPPDRRGTGRRRVRLGHATGRRSPTSAPHGLIVDGVVGPPDRPARSASGAPVRHRPPASTPTAAPAPAPPGRAGSRRRCGSGRGATACGACRRTLNARRPQLRSRSTARSGRSRTAPSCRSSGPAAWSSTAWSARRPAARSGIWGAGGGAPATRGGADCAPPAGVPDAARQVVVVTSSGAPPTSTSSSTTAPAGSAPAWTCRAGRPQRRPHPGRPPLRRRHDAGRRVRPRHDDRPGRPDVPVLRQRRQPGVPGAWRQVRGGDCWGATPARRTTTCWCRVARAGVHRRRRVPAEHHRRLLGGGADRRQHGPGPLGRPARRAAAGGGDLPPPPLLRRRRQRQADGRLRVAERRQPGVRAPTPRPRSGGASSSAEARAEVRRRDDGTRRLRSAAPDPVGECCWATPARSPR